MASRNEREGRYIGHVWRRHVRMKNRPGPISGMAALIVLRRGVARGTIRVSGDRDNDAVRLALGIV